MEPTHSALSENERLRPFLLGVAAAVIGLSAAVTVSILETSVTDVYKALIALRALAAPRSPALETLPARLTLHDALERS